MMKHAANNILKAVQKQGVVLNMPILVLHHSRADHVAFVLAMVHSLGRYTERC